MSDLDIVTEASNVKPNGIILYRLYFWRVVRHCYSGGTVFLEKIEDIEPPARISIKGGTQVKLKYGELYDD